MLMSAIVQDKEKSAMTVATNSSIERSAAYYRLKADIEDFYYHEADLLDDRRFRDWLDILTGDISYFMPIRRNVKFGQHASRENTKLGEGISWFDEDKWTLTKRVEQILTGVHYAEEPLSRISHMVSNIQIRDVRPNLEAPGEIDVTSRFLVYQNRVEYETYTFVGRRNDTLRATGNGWKVAKREILLEQNILLAKNLTMFF
jgi:3-phenylpropionate/cinnamic acid dioxygenase small subunit